MRIPYNGNRILGIHHITTGTANGRRKNQNNQGMERTNERQRNPEFPRIRQLLLKVYTRLQPDHNTPHPPDKEGSELGMGR